MTPSKGSYLTASSAIHAMKRDVILDGHFEHGEPDQMVFLILSWSMYRLEASMRMDTNRKRSTARYICAILDPSYEGTTVEAQASTHGDGLSIAFNDVRYPYLALGSRNIDTGNLDFNMIRTWLSRCDSNHKLPCARITSDELKAICLIDVHQRKIVGYSNKSKEYLALSYVWGNVEQYVPGAGKADSDTILGNLPQIVEDALLVTNQLGKKYLWVDSICIDQTDKVQKAHQIAIMSQIYQGAYATIIAFSTTSANDRLPRVSSANTSWRQMSCTIDGIKILGFGPTLSHLVWHMRWGRRAWTYQEALLSPRCIYISKFQVYFECNAVTCCESVNESYSHIHQESSDGNYLPLTNTGVLRNPFTNVITEPGTALSLYSISATLFSRRTLTKQSDALNAFDGILQILQRKAYGGGFYWALPCAHLNWALTWRAHDARDQEIGLRSEFPTWS
ncbi:HET-domain-containing protein [Viridothelium virens]|uniref:HET-domain-containing protein n=1 Tax=Viridothelium virens TaxID=1048519 RepID=A0A6A6HEE7_VIRVR|nr:HET-domain-containing protein [Viridothelium virens]